MIIAHTGAERIILFQGCLRLALWCELPIESLMYWSSAAEMCGSSSGLSDITTHHTTDHINPRAPNNNNNKGMIYILKYTRIIVSI